MSKKILQAAAGAGGESVYVDDVFSTYLYTGNDTTQTVTTGLDIANEGGLIWQKPRVADAYNNDHKLFDTERGQNKVIYTNNSAVEDSGRPLSYTSTGFTLDTSSKFYGLNENNKDYVTWNFVKQAGFFDIQTWTGNGTNRTISHDLGCVPGFIIVKRTSNAEDWTCYHVGVPGNANYIQLNKNDAYASNSQIFQNTAPTSSVFSIGEHDRVNTSGETYVAYLFAGTGDSDSQIFGDNSDESIIKCGSYTGTGSSGNAVNVGFEPQFVIIKRATGGTGNWMLEDVMRGMNHTGAAYLYANLSASEQVSSSTPTIKATSTGFEVNTTSVSYNTSSSTYIYIAIRRPMKTPESGTEVFAVDTYNQTSASDPAFNLGAVVDFGLRRLNNFESNWTAQTRLTGDKGLTPNATDAESTQNYGNWDNMVGWYQGASITPPYSQANWYGWSFKRATGFFDVVTFPLTNGVDSSHSHNLGVTPELILSKLRSGNDSWIVYNSTSGTGNYLLLNEVNAVTANANVYSAVGSSTFNLSGVSPTGDYVSYLFATLAGVSKVGSYTGTGSNVDVDCGFSAGARFILIKRTDSSGDWYVWDSARGIVAGNDPYLLLNSTAAEVTGTDYIDPLSSGFTVTSSAPAGLNASGGSYIFLAIS